MENVRNSRKDLTGIVTSISGSKSIKVTYGYKRPHRRYRKVINRKTVVHVHDEGNDARLGDRVEIMETRPISRLKRWRLVRVIDRAPIVGESILDDPEPAKAAEVEAVEAEAETEAEVAEVEAPEVEAPEAEAEEAETEEKED